VFCGYETCPAEVKQQIQNVAGGLSALLGTNLLGLYLHGSLVLGAFDVNSSDIDMIGVVEHSTSLAERVAVGSLLLSIDHKPCPIEVKLIIKEGLIPWHFPPPCHFFYSEYWTWLYQRFASGEDLSHILLSGHPDEYDRDLAAEIKLINQCGVCVYGLPAPELFPDVPEEDYWDAISDGIDDFYVESDNPSQSSFLILTLCRTFMYRQTGVILSKHVAASRALEILPDKYHPIISNALYNKYGLGRKAAYTAEDALSFKSYIIERIEVQP